LCMALEELRVAEEEMKEQTAGLAIARVDLESGHQRYRDLFEHAPDGYLVTDAEGTITEANQAAARLLNVPARYLAGASLLAFLPEEDRAEALLLGRSLPAGEPAAKWELRLRPRSSLL